MSGGACRAPIALAVLVEYWLRELDETREEAIEEHLFECAGCAAALQDLVALGAAVRAAWRHGRVRAVVSGEFVRRLAEQGLRVREYRVPRNGGVNCSVGPDDDLVVSRLEAPLADLTRLDLIEVDPEGREHRFPDIPFNAASGEVVIVPDTVEVRALPASTTRVRLVAVEPAGERVIGEYAFNHTPNRAAPGAR